LTENNLSRRIKLTPQQYEKLNNAAQDNGQHNAALGDEITKKKSQKKYENHLFILK
jgi:hypothetical protein